jgi:hypothetical protein
MTLGNRVFQVRPLKFARTKVIYGCSPPLPAPPRPSHPPTVPPKNISLITVGATQPQDYRRFIEIAGCYLQTGDELNTATRVATLVPHPAETTNKE